MDKWTNNEVQVLLTAYACNAILALLHQQLAGSHHFRIYVGNANANRKKHLKVCGFWGAPSQ